MNIINRNGQSLSKIFEINVLNNLAREPIFIQIKSDLHPESSNIHSTSQPSNIHSTSDHGGGLINPQLNMNLQLGMDINSPIKNNIIPNNRFNIVNQRYMNQQRSRQQNHTIYNTATQTVPIPIPIPIPTNEDIEQDNTLTVPIATPIKEAVDEMEHPFANNDIILPGFARIAPCQTLPIPVLLNNKYNDWIAFVTIYVEDIVNNKIICLANQLQINRQNIEIKRSQNGNIVIKPICYTQNPIDNLLYSWGIPQYLINSMKNNGWENIGLWDAITETDLILMGFQRGHRRKFFDKLTDLLQNQNTKSPFINNNLNLNHNHNHKLLYVKYIFSSWNLPLYLSRNMIEQGWTDPLDWTEITDHHFKKMGFKDGHIIKFCKKIKNNKHLVAFQQMSQQKMAQLKKIKISQQNNLNKKIQTEQNINNIPLINKNMSSFDAINNPIPIFIIDPTTITHEQCWYKLKEIKPNFSYYLEMKIGQTNNDNDNNNNNKHKSDENEWYEREEITDTKRRNICELDMSTTYFIRIRAENKRNRYKITYSQIGEVRTKNGKWKNMHLPKIPDFKYFVSSNNKQITLEFDSKSLSEIKQTQFDERYSLDIGLSKDNDLERIVNWKNVATLRKDKLVYSYNVNDQKDADWVHVGISARNDLGQRYNQCTHTRQFPFNQVIKRINTTKHGNNLQFDETMTVATKIDQDYRYSTFAFGQPITNEMCNRYDMYVKVNKLKTDCFMGFAPSLDSVIDWNQALGYGGNKDSSVGVLANKLSADFAVYNKDQSHTHTSRPYTGYGPFTKLKGLQNNNEQKWDDGSIFVLSFDFLNDDCNIYLNEDSNSNGLDQNRLLKSIKLNQLKSVVPSFSLNSQGDSIQVVKWRLY